MILASEDLVDITAAEALRAVTERALEPGAGDERVIGGRFARDRQIDDPGAAPCTAVDRRLAGLSSKARRNACSSAWAQSSARWIGSSARTSSPPAYTATP